MKKKSIFILCIILGVLLFLFYCNLNSTYLETNNAPTISIEPTISNEPIIIGGVPFSNDINFTYNKTSNMDISDFKQLNNMSFLNNKYPIFAVRMNKNNFYTIYNLAQGKLCYVIFSYDAFAGVSYRLKDIVEYPFTDESDKYIYDFLLEKDYPEKIITN